MHKFRKKRVVLIVTSAALIGALSFSTLLSDFALGNDTQKINDLTKQQQNLQNQIKDTKNDLKNTTIEKNKQLNQLNQINSNIDAAQNTIDSLAASITETENNIAAAENEIANKQRDYDGRMAIFCNRLKEMYEYGDMNYVDVLFQSSDFSDFLTRFEYLRYVADNDNKLLEEVVALRTSLEEQKNSLETQKTSLEAQKKQHS